MAVSVDVAVIARREQSLDACLAALAAAGVTRPMIVTAGEEGMAVARNRALAGCHAAVLALVEDDVAVCPAWLAELTSAWDGGGEALACVGGPLRAAFPHGRPRWLPETLLTAFATLDLGDVPLTVDANAHTFHGGNVSFRASALRAVGGFWPARGHPDGRDWFSEEHEAQRELARAGWTAAYAPQVAADRLAGRDLAPRVILRRRLRYGARSSVLAGGRPTATAARAVATGAIGVPIALAGGDRSTAMQRAARVAENAGALIGEPLVRADIRPTVGQTPFLVSVPSPPSRPRRRARGTPPSPIVLLYHRVTTMASDPLGLCVSPQHFAAHLDVLAATRGLLALGELVSGAVAPDAVAITIDDGYRDIWLHAAPALVAANAPATLFVATGHVAHARGFWWDDLDRILRDAPADAAPTIGLALCGQERIYRVATPQQRQVARRHLQAWLHPMSAESIAEATSSLRAWAGLPAAGPVPAEYRPMSIDEVRSFAALPGLAVGAHSRSHRSLRHAGGPALDDEIIGSRDDVAAWADGAPAGFSYPFGVPGTDVDRAVMDRVAAAGFDHAVINAPGAVTAGTDRFAIPRYAVPDLDGPGFAGWLDQIRGRGDRGDAGYRPAVNRRWMARPRRRTRKIADRWSASRAARPIR